MRRRLIETYGMVEMFPLTNNNWELSCFSFACHKIFIVYIMNGHVHQSIRYDWGSETPIDENIVQKPLGYVRTRLAVNV